MRAERGQDQTGHAAAAPEVQHAGNAGRQAGVEPTGVLDVGADGAGAEETQPVGVGEYGLEPVQGQFALMTTRRRGSSPSEKVSTPSMALTVSWTTFRSPGDMGSKT